LTGFYIHPEFQGKGVGKQLYQLALDFGGRRDLLLDIYTHNHKTISMYKKWGWALDDTQGDKGYFYRHWDEWPKDLQAKCMYMKLKQSK
jgi:GNAT superfamily N-acetyltransferase